MDDHKSPERKWAENVAISVAISVVAILFMHNLNNLENIPEDINEVIATALMDVVQTQPVIFPASRPPEIGHVIIFRSNRMGWIEGVYSPTFGWTDKSDRCYGDVDYWMETPELPE